MKLSDHFETEEFACRDGTPYPEEWVRERLLPLVQDLELLRAELGAPIRIESGYRTPKYNRKIGGAPNSLHIQGLAVDFAVDRKELTDVRLLLYALIREGTVTEGGVGIYPTFIHYDHRGYRARWAGKRVGN